MNARRPLAVLTAGAVVGAALLCTTPTVAGAQQAPRPIVLDQGHIDLFEVTYDDTAGGLVLSVKDDSWLYGLGTQYHDPADVTIDVHDAALFEVPELPEAYQNLIGPAGTSLYLLETYQQDGLPWPGWSSERLPGTLPPGVELPNERGAVVLDVDVEGPGDVVTFFPGNVGPEGTFINTKDPAPDQIPMAASSHVHTAWIFTEPGDYHFTVTPSAFPTDGGVLTGPTVDYHIHVGGDLLVPPVPELTTTVDGPVEPVPHGTPVTLTASTEGGAGGTYRWYESYQDSGGNQFLRVIGTSPSVTVTPVAFGHVGYSVAYVAPNGRVASVGGVWFQVLEPEPVPDRSQTITAALDPDEGTLAIRVDPNDRDVVFWPFELDSGGDRWVSYGQLKRVTIIDTRPTQAGWTASGQATDLTSDGNALGAEHLGWEPYGYSFTPQQQTVVNGDPVAPALDGGPGLGASRTLATGEEGASRGTALAGGNLVLIAPTDTDPGTYEGLVTFTVV